MREIVESCHDYRDLITIFNHCFTVQYNTLLVRGEDEPLYQPATDKISSNILYFAHGFFSSALHECAHWLIAGQERRKLVDFGYWYTPDGRTAAQQELFQHVEVKPQALEWILSVATGHHFSVSLDNLSGTLVDSVAFKAQVYAQVLDYCAKGLPKRAHQFRHALCLFYHTDIDLKADSFNIKAL